MRKLGLVLVVAMCVMAASAASGAAKKAPAAPTRTAAQHKEAGLKEFSRKLGLSKSQESSLKAIAAKVDADIQKVFASKDSDKTKQARVSKIAVDAQSKIMALLTPAQRKKYAELTRVQVQASAKGRPAPGGAKMQPVQQQEHRMSFAEAMQKKLSRVKLSKTQRAKTDAIMKDFVKKHTALKNDPKLGTKRKPMANELKGATMTKIRAVLTPAQLKEFEKKL